MRYIDADGLKDTIQNNDYVLSDRINSTDRGMFTTGIFEAIDAQPTADVRENVRGEWIRWYEEIKHDGYTEYIPHCKCPKCETEYDSHTAKFINFCPNCGADMRDKL